MKRVEKNKTLKNIGYMAPKSFQRKKWCFLLKEGNRKKTDFKFDERDGRDERSS